MYANFRGKFSKNVRISAHRRRNLRGRSGKVDDFGRFRGLPDALRQKSGNG